ncbi:hypothetical protein C0Q70_09659 [Pomacea canaliculata]|uniref:Uncharacterized protein n=1 Tax=Pomacea canaliculata TaxID=400727 RepID=A0A2T7PAF4_POMCA|nr:hypothetical protein C0Q70_09659 [Pomacea canaliculata]
MAAHHSCPQTVTPVYTPNTATVDAHIKLKHFPYTSNTTLVRPHPSQQQQQQHVCDVDRGRSSPAGRPNFDVRLLDFSSEEEEGHEQLGKGRRWGKGEMVFVSRASPFAFHAAWAKRSDIRDHLSSDKASPVDRVALCERRERRQHGLKTRPRHHSVTTFAADIASKPKPRGPSRADVSSSRSVNHVHDAPRVDTWVWVYQATSAL